VVEVFLCGQQRQARLGNRGKGLLKDIDLLLFWSGATGASLGRLIFPVSAVAKPHGFELSISAMNDHLDALRLFVRVARRGFFPRLDESLACLNRRFRAP
jgi:hypothetical protein